MRAGGSKTKGNAHEWVVAKALGKALFEDPSAFIRSPGSGALHTIRNIMGTVGKGDICVAGDVIQVRHMDKFMFPYSIECKAWKEFKIIDLLLKNEKSIAYKAWLQAVRDAESVGRFPLLVFKENRKQIMVAHRYLDAGDGYISEVKGDHIGNNELEVYTFEEFLGRWESMHEVYR